MDEISESVDRTSSSEAKIYIPKHLNPGLRNRLLRLAAFQNPEFYKGRAMRLLTYNKPRVVACAEDLPQANSLRVATR